MPKRILQARTGENRSRERPKKWWLDNIDKDLRRVGARGWYLPQVAESRKEWGGA